MIRRVIFVPVVVPAPRIVSSGLVDWSRSIRMIEADA